MSKIHPILTAICRPDDKFCLDNPFRIGDFVYASNGKIAIRCPYVDGMVIPARSNKPVPPITSKIDWDRDHYAIIADMIVLPEKDQLRCACTHGGFTKPKPTCEECAGTGWVTDEFTPVEIAPGAAIGWAYADLLIKHHIVYIYEMTMDSPLYNQTDPVKNPFYFEGEGFAGVVMKVKI